MRAIVTVIVAAAIVVAVVAVAGSAAAAPLAPAGVQSRHYPAPEMHTWRGQKDHTLAVDVWYPAADGAVEKPFAVPPGAPLFDAGRLARDARSCAPCSRSRRSIDR